MKRTLLIALRMTVLSLLALGVVYPLVITGIARLAFPRAAAGSLVEKHGAGIGSEQIGQSFETEFLSLEGRGNPAIMHECFSHNSTGTAHGIDQRPFSLPAADA